VGLLLFLGGFFGWGFACERAGHCHAGQNPPLRRNRLIAPAVQQ